MVWRVFALFCVGAMTLISASCGQTYELQSINVTPSSPDIEGIGSTQQLVVTAVFSNTKTQVVTSSASYELGGSADASAPLDAVTLSKSGMLQAVTSPTLGTGACTWHATPTNSADSAWSYSTQPYTVTITYRGFTVPAYVSVNSEAGCYDTANPPPVGFTGN